MELCVNTEHNCIKDSNTELTTELCFCVKVALIILIPNLAINFIFFFNTKKDKRSI